MDEAPLGSRCPWWRKKNPIASTTTMARPEYIIEHMEEDEPDAPAHFPPWALLEYVGHGAQY